MQRRERKKYFISNKNCRKYTAKYQINQTIISVLSTDFDSLKVIILNGAKHFHDFHIKVYR